MKISGAYMSIRAIIVLHKADALLYAGAVSRLYSLPYLASNSARVFSSRSLKPYST